MWMMHRLWHKARQKHKGLVFDEKTFGSGVTVTNY